MGKKIVVPCLDVITIAFFREIYIEVLFLPEKRAKILSECPLAAVSVKWSIVSPH